MVVYTCRPSTCETEAGLLQIQCKPGLHRVSSRRAGLGLSKKKPNKKN